MSKATWVVLPLVFSGLAQAEIVNIPQESGFSGFVMGGVGGIKYKSNLYKGPNDDNERHNGGFNEPDTHSSMIPVYGGDLRYTFGESRTQLFVGGLLQDAVRFDFTQQVGVRQEIGDYGIVSVSYVFPLQPGKTWTDPYADGVRDETDIKSNGGRFGWEQIGGSSFNAFYTVRKFDIENELSGQSLLMTPADQALLDRNGKTHDIALSYDWLMAPGHLLRPELTYTQANLDGEAMKHNRTSLQLSYGYHQPRWSLVSNLYGGILKYDQDNPIYGKKADATEVGVSSTLFWHEPGGLSNLNAFVTAAYGQSNSDIDFYDLSVASLSTGLLYRF